METFASIKTLLTTSGDTLTLDAGELTDAFDSLIRACNGNNPFVIRNVNVEAADDAYVALSGNADYKNVARAPVVLEAKVMGGDEVQVTLRFQLVEDGPRRANSWTFSHSFPKLPLVMNYSTQAPVSQAPDAEPVNVWSGQKPYLDALGPRNAWFVLTTHDHQDAQFDVPMRQGLNFVGHIRPAGQLGVLEYAFSETTLLTLYGTIREPRATERVRALMVGEGAWSQPDLPGIHLQAKLDVGFQFGKALSLQDCYLRIYSPTSQAWLSDNPTYAPTQGYTGLLTIPSAEITVKLTGVLKWGANQLGLKASCSGVTLGKLAGLVDIAGSKGLQSKLPKSLNQALDTLEALELMYVGISLQLGNGLPQIDNVELEVGFPNLQWELWDDHFVLDALSCRIDVSNPFASPLAQNPSLPASAAGKPQFHFVLNGRVEIEGVQLQVQTRSKEQWTVYANMPYGETIPLGRFMNRYLPEVPCPSDLTIDQLALRIAPGKSYNFGVTLASQPTPWTIPLGAQTLAISDVYLELAYAKSGGVSGGFGGGIALAGQRLSLNYRIPGDFEIKGAFQYLTMQEIVEVILGAKVDLPDGLDFTFSTASVLISKDSDNYLFRLAAFIEDLGYFGMEIRRQPSTGWGVVAGMSLPDVQLSDLPGLKDLAALEKVVDLKELSLFIAGYDGAQLQFPGLEKFGNPTLVGHNIPVTPGTGGLIAGVNASATWRLDTSRKEMALLKTILGLNPEMEVAIQVSRAPSENSRLYFRFDTAFNNGRDPFSGQLGFALVNGSPSLFLAAQYSTRIQKQPVMFDVAMSIVKGGIYFSGSMQGTVSFDQVQLSNVALALGFNWSGIPTLGLAASLNISGWQSSIAVLFDSTDPSKSLLAGAISDVSLADIANGLAEGDIPKEIEDVLDDIEITGTRPFNIPYDEIADDLDERDLEATVAAFKKYGEVTLSGSADQVLQVVGAPGKQWNITDMANNLRHYQLERKGDQVQVSLNPQFYLAPAGAQMGRMVFPQGYFVTGTLNILGLKWTSYVEIRNNKGIAVSSQLNKPLEIYDPGFFSLAAAEGDTGPKLSMATFKQPELEDKEFRNPHIYINGSLTMLGSTSLTYVKGTTKGFEFQITLKRLLALPGNKVFSGRINGSFTLNGLFDTITNFNGGASFSLTVKGKMNLAKLIGIADLPKLSLDLAVSGSISMGYNGKKAYAKASGQFRFEGTQYSFKTTLQATNAQIADAGEWVMSKLEDVLKDLLDTGEKLVQALEDGWMEIEGGAEATAKILTQGYNETKEEALEAASDVYKLGADGVASVGKELNMTAKEVGGFMKDVKGWGDDTVAGALQGARFATEDVWNFMQDAYGWFKHVDIGHYDKATVKWHGDVSKRYHLDKRQHFDIKVAKWKPHLDEGTRIGINERVNLTPHVDLPHADFRPTPKKPHIDESGINIRKGRYGGKTYSSPHADFKAGVSKKIVGKRFHLDIGHADARLKVQSPKVPTRHIDVGHVDVGASLDKPNKKTTRVKGRK